MKKHNKIIAGVMALSIAFLGGIRTFNENYTSSFSISAHAVEKYDDFTYIVTDDNTITITGVDKSATDIVIPEKIDDIPVTFIEDYSISNHFALKSVVMPDSIKGMGYYTFYGCSSLESVTFSKNLKSIPKYAFSGCRKLVSLNLPESITFIGENAFSNCISLESINIPSKVTEINYQTFDYCNSLKSITFHENISLIFLYAFSNGDNLKEIKILNPNCKICNRADTFNEKAAIYGYENSTAQAYAEKYGYKFESLGKAPEENTATGDMNGDNEFNISDVVLFQKYILGSSDTEISDWKQADLYPDGVLDVFDLCLMRKKLIEK